MNDIDPYQWCVMMGIISKLRNWLLLKRQRVSTWLWGYDYFISYHWQSGGKYAVALSQILYERKYDCFLDKTEFVPGDDWREEATRALKSTQRLIVIATREAITTSEPVAHEVSLFAHRSKHIIPIRFGEAFTEDEINASPVMTKIKESVIQLADTPHALSTGKPDSEKVVDLLIKTDKVLRRRKLRLPIVGSVVSVLLVAVLVVTVLGLIANSTSLKAEERAQEAEVAAEKAIAAQNFAEFYRVSQRAEASGVDPDEKRALEAIAPKYLEQSHKRLERATDLKKRLDEWRNKHGRRSNAPNQTFSLEFIPTRFTAAILLYFGFPSDPRFILIDGGDQKGYRQKVKPVLKRLAQHSQNDKPLQLDLVISSQVDIWQIGGLSEMVEELAGLRGSGNESPWLSINTLWANSFLPFAAKTIPSYVGDSKIDLLIAAHALNILVNKPFSQWVAVPEAGAARVQWPGGLEITVLAPKLDATRDFAKFWMKRLKKQAKRGRLSLVSNFEEPDIVETFTDTTIELLPSPIIPADIADIAGKDGSVPNLASIVLMLESGNKRILLTSDTTDEILLETLGQAGYLDANEECRVDVLILPHDGSDRNVSKEFFTSIVADHYVALGDGGHTNPEVKTFR